MLQFTDNINSMIIFFLFASTVQLNTLPPKVKKKKKSYSST